MQVGSVLFVADKLANENRGPGSPYPGGAEQTDAAILAAAPFPVTVLRFSEVPPEQFAEFDLVIVGNSGDANRTQLAALAQHQGVILFEHDLRICRRRGNFSHGIHPSHRLLHTCLCKRRPVLDLYKTARGTIYLTEFQRRYYRRNPFYHEGPYRVLGSSVMDEQFFDRVTQVGSSSAERDIPVSVAYSVHRNKGFEPAMAKARGIFPEPFVIRDRTPADVLDLLARSQAFVYTPRAPEWGSRLSLEARFMGCDLHTNSLVGVVQEPWWSLPDNEALEHLRSAADRFWKLVVELFGP